MHAGSLATRLPCSAPAPQESLQAGELLGVGGSRVLLVGVCGGGYDGLSPSHSALPSIPKVTSNNPSRNPTAPQDPRETIVTEGKALSGKS